MYNNNCNCSNNSSTTNNTNNCFPHYPQPNCQQAEYYNQCMNVDYTHMYQYPSMSVGCRCDMDAVEAAKNMADQSTLLNQIKVLQTQFKEAYSEAGDLFYQSQNNSYVIYLPDKQNVFSAYSQGSTSALLVNTYYQRAIDALKAGYECCQKNSIKNNNCWYATNSEDCKQYMGKVEEILAKIAPKKSLLEQIIYSTRQLGKSVKEADSNVNVMNFFSNEAADFSFRFMEEQIKHLQESYKQAYEAYNCCKNTSKNCMNANDMNICTCKNLYKMAQNEIHISDMFNQMYTRQQDQVTKTYATAVQAEVDDQSARSYLYAALQQSAALTNELSVLWEQAYVQAEKAYECCSNNMQGASCATPQCGTFLKEAQKLRDTGKMQQAIAIDNYGAMEKDINKALEMKVEEVNLVKEAQDILNQIFDLSNKVNTNIRTIVLPKINAAYQCCIEQ